MRDYEVSTTAEELLAALEEAAANREVGGQVKWEPPGYDEEADEGGTTVPA